MNSGQGDLPAVAATCEIWLHWEEPRCLAMWGGEPFRRAWAGRKRARVGKTWEEWGRCGFLALVDRNQAGYVQHAPAQCFPGFYEYDCGVKRPPDEDVLVTCLHVPIPFRGSGIGARLLSSVVADYDTSVRSSSRHHAARNSAPQYPHHT